jgi:hypothetical protein
VGTTSSKALWPVRSAAAASLLCLALGAPGEAWAEAVDPDLPEVLIAAGAEWTIRNLQGGGSQGLVVEDARLGAFDDAVDFGARLSVAGEAYVAPAAQRTGNVYAAGAAQVGPLQVSARHGLDDFLPILGTLADFANPTGAPVAASVAWEVDLASDAASALVTTSSGDAVWTPDDRWVVVDDGLDGAGTAAVAFVSHGSGSPDSSPARTYLSTATGSEGLRVEFDLLLPAQATSSLLFLLVLADTRQNAVLVAANVDEFLTDLDLFEVGVGADEAARIANFDLPSAVPALGAWALAASLLLALGGALLLRGRRQKPGP